MSISVGKPPLHGRPAREEPAAPAGTAPLPATASVLPSRDGFNQVGEGAPEAEALAPGAPVASAGDVYTVQKGDTPAGLAGRFGLTVEQLAKANALPEPLALAPGQRLVMPGRAIATIGTATTLAGLAAQLGCQVADLATANGLQAKSPLAVGSQLWLSDATLYPVKATDTLPSVAKRFHTTAQALSRANGLAAGQPLKVGQLLVVFPGTPAKPHRLLPEPSLMNEHRRSWHYAFDRKGKLFLHGLSPDDVEQGQAGDCYLLSAIASVAHTHPEVLRQAIHPNGDGTFTVTFHEQKWTCDQQGRWHPRFVPVKVTVDDRLPGTEDGYRLYAQEGRSGHEEWVPLLEKAYAQWKGGYEQIGEGGWPATTLSELTGKPSEPIAVNQPRPKLYATLEQKLAAGESVCASTKDDSPVLQKNGIVGDHAYSVLGVTTRHGERFVQLRNPWGNTEFGHDGKNDGTFLMPLERFQKCFAGLDCA